jgi:hypothetical protein
LKFRFVSGRICPWPRGDRHTLVGLEGGRFHRRLGLLWGRSVGKQRGGKKGNYNG